LDILDRTQADLRRSGSELDLVVWEYLRAAVALLDGDLVHAEALARSAIERLPHDANAVQLSLAHQALADALAARGELDEARHHYVLAGDLRIASKPGRGAALQWRDLGERLLAMGDVEKAVMTFRRALDAAGVRNRTKAVLAAIAESSGQLAVDDMDAATLVEETIIETSAVSEQG
jgi:tetratricopeptide (TPR) repeat protein